MSHSLKRKVRPDRFAGGAQSIPLTVASSRTWRDSQGSAAPVPSGRTLRIPQTGVGVNEAGLNFISALY